MMISVPSRSRLIGIALISGSLLAGCAGSKDSSSSRFDTSDYRKAILEQQKGPQGVPENLSPPASDMTADELERAGDSEVQRRNYGLAQLHYANALTVDHARDAIRLKLGQLFLQQGMLDPALAQFQDFLDRKPNSASAYQGIGKIYLLQGKLREAEDVLRKALALDPSSWPSQNMLGLVYDREQRYGDAITAYQAALTLRPNEPGILNNLGLAYALSGNQEAAIQRYEQAVTAGSTSPRLNNNLGVAYARVQRYGDALASFKKATDEPGAYNNLGVVLLRTGYPKKAAACFEKSIALSPHFYEKAEENLRQARQALENAANETAVSNSTDSTSCL